MTRSPERRGGEDAYASAAAAPFWAVACAGALAGLPALVGGLALEGAAARSRRLPWLALAGLMAVGVLWPYIRAEALGVLEALAAVSLAGGRGPDWSGAWPHLLRWWLLSLPAAPTVAFALDLARPRTGAERMERDRVRAADRERTGVSRGRAPWRNGR